uniref:Putative transporter n=1 Tax=Talaromyces marneffei PM1 TaxID=1077442 RepID=A0A093V9X1_TALMA
MQATVVTRSDSSSNGIPIKTDEGILTREEAEGLVNPAAEKKLIRKLDAHVILPVGMVFFWAFVDRVNLGYARLQGIEKDLHMVGNDFNVALLVQIAPYIFFEIPSNLTLKRVRAVYLTSMYYTRYELQKRMVGLYMANCIAIATSGLIAYGMTHLEGHGGYHSWRWIYIIEGTITIGLSVFLFFIIADWPGQAKWLSADEKILLRARQIVQDGGLARMDRLDRKALFRILSDWKIYSAIIIYFGVSASVNATAFVPSIIARLGYTNAAALAYTIPIYVVAGVLAFIAAVISDRILLCVCGYAVLLNQDKVSLHAQYGALFLFNGGCFMVLPTLWTWLSNNMAGHYKRSWSSAAQIGLGNAGAIVPTMTYVAKEAPAYTRAYSVSLALIVAAGLVMVLTKIGLWWENKIRDQGKRDYRLNLPQEEVENLGDDHPSFRFTY